MKDNFKTLSDWIVEKDVLGQDKKIGYIHEKAVMEFIRLLKKELTEKLDLKTTYPKDYKIVMNMIDKLAGEKLI
jgi:hypothetical protein